jgi:hypothetical protein
MRHYTPAEGGEIQMAKKSSRRIAGLPVGKSTPKAPRKKVSKPGGLPTGKLYPGK